MADLDKIEQLTQGIDNLVKKFSTFLAQESVATKQALRDRLEALSIEEGILQSRIDKQKVDVNIGNIQKQVMEAEKAYNKLQIDNLNHRKGATKDAVAAALKEFKTKEHLLKEETETTDKKNKLYDDFDSKLGGINQKLKGLVDTLKLAPELVAAGIILSIYKKVWQTFVQLDEAAADFRKSIGATRSDTVQLEAMARGIAINYAKLGVSAKDVYGSIKDIADALGSSQYATKGVTENMALFQAQLGISTKTSAQFLKTMAMVGNTTMEAQKDMMFFAQHMSAAAGVPLDAVMNDIAEASQESYQFLSRNPLELVKAAVEAKRMGTSLASATKSSSSLLNFTESVKNEMEASVLLGKSINLQKARELAYHRDIRGLNNEILKIATETNFENLDPFQQDAIAKALGKSAGEIATMVQSDRERLALQSHMTAKQKEQYKTYQDMLSANASNKKSYEDKAKAELTSLSNQAAMKAITAAWGSIIGQISSAVLPAIATVLTGIAYVIGKISDGFGYVNEKLHGALSWILAFAGAIYGVIKGIGFINSALKLLGRPAMSFGGIIDSIGSLLMKPVKLMYQLFVWGQKLGGVLGNVFRFLGMGVSRLFGWLNPIGKIMTAFSVGFGIGTFLNKFKWVQNAAQAVWLAIFKIGDGIAAVGGMIYETLKKPFVKVWDWLKGMFLGNSPSQLGLMIVDGIMAVESMLIKALISPFEKAWDFIKGLPLISHLFGHKDVGAAAGPEAKATMTVERPKAEVDSKKASGGVTDAVSGMGDDMAKRMGAIVDAINCLREDMKNGVLTANVYIDSQKLDSAVGRRLAYTGQLT